METGNHYQRIIFDNEKERVREAAQESAAHVLKNGGKLPGIGADTFCKGINRFAETST